MTCQPGDLPARLFVPANIGRGVPMPQQRPPCALLGPSRDAQPVSVLNQASPSTVLPHAAATLRPSACPGLLRIVAARDGGICRIKLAGGELSAAQARAIADASERHAAGVIELTNRANLQVRGVRAGQETALIEALMDAGLGPTTVTPAADDVRNVMMSPVAGRDLCALFDTRPLCTDLLMLLQSDARFAALSPKFALLLDGGERLARVDHPHDVWLAASQSRDGVRFVYGLAGCPTTGALASVLPSQAPALVRALLHTYLDLATADATRMRHLLADHSADALLLHAQRYVDFPLSRDASLANWQRGTYADASLRLGAHAQRSAGMHYVGGQPSLGRLDAAMLRGLAGLSQQHGNGALHVTPWQSVLLTDIVDDAVPAVLDALTTAGLACDPTEPLTRLIACAGSQGCAKGLADTKADALELARHLPAGVEVHLSGCQRSCAAAHCAPYTLLATAPGTYDLYRRDGQPGFGQCVAHQLTIGQAAGILERLPRSDNDA